MHHSPRYCLMFNLWSFLSFPPLCRCQLHKCQIIPNLHFNLDDSQGQISGRCRAEEAGESLSGNHRPLSTGASSHFEFLSVGSKGNNCSVQLVFAEKQEELKRKKTETAGSSRSLNLSLHPNRVLVQKSNTHTHTHNGWSLKMTNIMCEHFMFSPHRLDML